MNVKFTRITERLVAILAFAIVVGVVFLLTFGYVIGPSPKTPQWMAGLYQRPLTGAQKARMVGNCILQRYPGKADNYEDVYLRCGPERYTPQRPGSACVPVNDAEERCSMGIDYRPTTPTTSGVLDCIGSACTDWATWEDNPFPEHPVNGQVEYRRGQWYVYSEEKHFWQPIGGRRWVATDKAIRFLPNPVQNKSVPPETKVIPPKLDPRGWYLLNANQYYVPKRDGITCAYIGHLQGNLWFGHILATHEETPPIIGEPAVKREVYGKCGHDNDVLDNIRGALSYGTHSSDLPAAKPDAR